MLVLNEQGKTVNKRSKGWIIPSLGDIRQRGGVKMGEKVMR